MTIDQTANNLVLTSNEQFLPPLSMDIGLRGTAAPGIIPCMVFWTGETGTDEIDLE